jgi:Protein of unknown function (DUF2735)
MTKQPDARPTAKIYAFPSMPRVSSSSHHQAYSPAQRQAAAPFAPVIFGTCWYHDAAIEEADEADVVPYRH